ncbi:glycine betaine ABC transporter substrate-binding protein [Alkalibacillus salilacus]|uniref:Glycine betaine/proline transport system substrate-binding protein n=1 Tax=Alkalibacillus salilacus TaxID=284582 RepID=A0ABT9VG99_9BACI|nr:glycine betaine ABC transporter substrate-binding protein [Alkalibacillus salilacus]MDQ0159999.1 glycine betaine/proline transport system substrate-binding protein [Alkalibacillus salilacus]
MHFNKKALLLILTGMILIVLAACGGEESPEGSDQSEGANEEENSEGSESSEGDVNQETIEMGQINWAENIAVTNMWKVILEEQGYNVDLVNLDMGPTMEALANDELDLGLEVWLPVQDANYLDQYEDQVFFSEATWYDNAKVGLVVPEYMEDINSIEDLNENADKFDGEITGFDSGAGTMEVTEEMIQEYDLELELMPSSEPAMIAAIDKAVKNEEPIVAPLWNPHSIFAKHDLKYLEDPKETYGGVEKIHFATRQGFGDEYPEFTQWLKNWKMDDTQIGELMAAVQDAEEPIDGARTWVENNQELVNEWMEQ